MRALLLLIVLLAPLAGAAYPDPDRVPRYHESVCHERFDKRFVHDYIGLYDDLWGAEMEGAACEVYATTSAHVVIVAVRDTEGEALETYAFRLFEAWGIGDDERLDGLMLLYVDDHLGSGQPALRIEVGYGLEGVVNSIVAEDAWDLMIERRDAALASGESAAQARAFATASGALFLMETLLAGYTEAGFPEPDPASDAPAWWFWVAVIVGLLLLAWLMSRTSDGSHGWGYHVGSTAWNAGSVWVGRGGGLGGGGSFGGGRSGGGGRGGRF